jgi:hypothetical protein
MRPRLVLELLSEEELVLKGVDTLVEMTEANGMRLESCRALTPSSGVVKLLISKAPCKSTEPWAKRMKLKLLLHERSRSRICLGMF